MFNTEIEDLKLQIVDGKKQNLTLKQENDALKIKLRKAESTITHRNKIIDSLLNGRQPFIGKNISEFGASLLITLKEENEKLKLKVAEQQRTIKRLKQELASSKLYLPSHPKTWSASVKSARSNLSVRSDICLQKSATKINVGAGKKEGEIQQRSVSEDRGKTKIDLDIPITTHKSENDKFTDNIRTKIESAECSEIETEAEEEYDIQSDDEDEDFVPEKKIIEKRVNSIMTQVGNADLTKNAEKVENKDKPHEEIQMLQNSFKDIINEVKGLKESICSIQKEQVKTCAVLEQKDSNLEKLAMEIKNMSMTQFNVNPSSDSTKDMNQLYKSIQMESKYKLNNRNPIGGIYGLTPKKKIEQNHTTRHQYKVISSPKFNPKAIHIIENNRKVLCTEDEVEKCMDNIISEL